MKQNISSPIGVRGPDISFPPNQREAIVTSRPGVGWEGSPLIDNWLEAPSSKTYVLGSIDGTIQWIPTKDCEE
jgi:hypothetical protein